MIAIARDHMIDVASRTDDIAFAVGNGGRSTGLAVVVAGHLAYGIDVAVRAADFPRSHQTRARRAASRKKRSHRRELHQRSYDQIPSCHNHRPSPWLEQRAMSDVANVANLIPDGLRMTRNRMTRCAFRNNPSRMFRINLISFYWEQGQFTTNFLLMQYKMRRAMRVLP
jgi:hypothetical protein